MLRLNVETIGDALIVQHYVAEVKEPVLCRMVSISDAINKNGRTKVKVEWTLSARKIDDQTTEYANHIRASVLKRTKCRVDVPNSTFVTGTCDCFAGA